MPSSERLHKIADLYDAGTIGHPYIEATFPLTDDGLNAAFAKMKSRRARGKVVMLVDASAGSADGGNAASSNAAPVKKEL